MTAGGEAAAAGGDTVTGQDPAERRWSDGLALGSLGVLAFSGTLPATRVAVPDFGPAIITLARIDIAAVLGLLTLALTGALRRPERRHLPGILATGLGLAVGFPVFVALAVEHVPASHGAVVIGLAPASTAVLAVIRTGERPPPRFWLASSMGVAAVVAFAASRGGGVQLADAWLLAAVLSVGIGYVEGGRVSRELGGTTTLCWAMIALAPLAAPVLVVEASAHAWEGIDWQAWTGFLYAGIVSMFLGSVAWYRGLAAGGIARIGQLNLAQPLLTLVWSALLLEEHFTWVVPITAIAVMLSMAVCVKSRVVTIAAPRSQR
jgi:drug/metabolite transporter (DMT)-like permease